MGDVYIFTKIGYTYNCFNFQSKVTTTEYLIVCYIRAGPFCNILHKFVYNSYK